MQAAVFLVGSVAAFLFHRYKNPQTHHLPQRSANTLYIGTRKSDLAMVQTHHIMELIEKSNPEMKVVLVKPQDTIGDINQKEHLRDLSLKVPGLFTKDLEEMLLLGHCDAVVHSLKDMPTRLPPGLVLASITKREDPLDVAVINKKHLATCSTIEQLPHGSVIGTSSVRREAQLLNRYRHKHFIYKIIRGNVNTRLKKLDDGEFDAIILAAAGLKRLGKRFEARITEFLAPPHFLYGVSQGALGIECREGDQRVIACLKKASEDWETSLRCLAERSMLRSLEGGCQLPLCVASRISPIEGHTSAMRLEISAKILDDRGERVIEADINRMVWNFKEAEWIGEELAKKLVDLGGKEILDGLKNSQMLADASRNISVTTKETPGHRRKRSSLSITYGSAEVPHLDRKPVFS